MRSDAELLVEGEQGALEFGRQPQIIRVISGERIPCGKPGNSRHVERVKVDGELARQPQCRECVRFAASVLGQGDIGQFGLQKVWRMQAMTETPGRAAPAPGQALSRPIRIPACSRSQRRSRSASNCSRKRNFCTLKLSVRGKSSTRTT